MKNVWIIAQKELKSYFASPIAYLLMAIFAVIFGFFFYSATAFFVMRGMEAQMMGRGQPMDVNEWVIRPLLSNASVIALFLIPMITMRLYAEEKRSGTMELLLTSPVRDIEIILGKFIASLIMFSCVIGVSALDLAALFAYGKPDWKPILVGYLGLLLQGGALIAIGTFISTTTKNQIIAGGATLTRHLIEPALQAAEEFLPRDSRSLIDGFQARDGIIYANRRPGPRWSPIFPWYNISSHFPKA